MGETAASGKPVGRALVGVALRVLRFPFDLLFLSWDFLRLSVWGIRNLPSLLARGRPLPFAPCFDGGILDETREGAFWYCPLAAKYGTKSLLRLLFPRLSWRPGEGSRPVLCWDGAASLRPTRWGRYLLTAVLLALLWGVPAGYLGWPYRHYVRRILRAGRPAATATAQAAPALRDPQMAAQLAVQAAELERSGQTDQARSRFRDAAARDPSLVAAHMGIGRTGLDLGLPDDARQAFARALELDPASSEAVLGLARSLHAQGAERKAIDVLQPLLQRHPDTAAAHVLHATCLMALNEMDAAVRAIETALALAPSDPVAVAAAADIELRRGRLDKAESYFRALVDQNAENLDGRVGLARILRIKGNTREAEALLRALLAEKPGLTPAIDELVDVLIVSDRPLDGLALCSDAVTKAPESTRLREKQIGILALVGRDNDLYVAATKLIADRPGNAAAHLQLAAMFLRKGLPAMAIEHCNTALAQQPGLEAAYRMLIGALLAAGDVEQARERAERLLALLPQDLDALVKLSECYRRKGQTDQALGVLRKAVGFHPGSPVARAQLAQTLFLAGDPKGALAEFREAYRLSPDDPKAMNNLAAVINYTDGDLDEALALAEQAQKLDRRNPQILDTLAWVHARRQDYGRALPLSETAIAVQPDLPILRYHYGAILAALGRPDEAKVSLKAALAFGADFHGSAEARALLQRLSAPPPTTSN